MACFDQVKIDHICEAMVRAALREAARLGVMAVEETGYGVSSDKEQKNQFAAEAVWEPEAARRCALTAARSATETLKERHDLGASVLVGQVRSMAVDGLAPKVPFEPKVGTLNQKSVARKWRPG